MGEKSERRSFVRRNHPDVGGDTDEFREGLKNYDAKSSPAPERPITAAAPPAAAARAQGSSATPTAGATNRTAPNMTGAEPVGAKPVGAKPVLGKPPAAPKPPAADRFARGLGRFAAKVAAKPAEAREAYREGRDTDNPI